MFLGYILKITLPKFVLLMINAAVILRFPFLPGFFQYLYNIIFSLPNLSSTLRGHGAQCILGEGRPLRLPGVSITLGRVVRL